MILLLLLAGALPLTAFEWQGSSAKEAGIDPDVIKAVFKSFDQDVYSCLIIRKGKVADEYLLKKNANRLQSQLIDRANISEWYEKKSDISKLFIDSGAYTAYTKGTQIDVDDYISYPNNFLYIYK